MDNNNSEITSLGSRWPRAGGVAEYRRLRAAWDAALAQKERRGSDADDLAEQDAYDALVDFVEENGLNYTEYDPRGAE